MVDKTLKLIAVVSIIPPTGGSPLGVEISHFMGALANQTETRRNEETLLVSLA